MKRAVLALGVLGVMGAVLAVLWSLRTLSVGEANHASLQETVESAITNPVGFTRSHFTGGIGAMLSADPDTGVPVVHQVIPGSPAEEAGLRSGDIVLKVNGVATGGQKLARVVDRIRGFAASSVTLTIQRPGSTNLECVLHRASWKHLGFPQ